MALRLLLLLTRDKENTFMHTLVDFSDIFGSIDHQILLSYSQGIAALNRKDLKWLRSFLSNEAWTVILRNFSSISETLNSRVQESILYPTLCNIYMQLLGKLVRL